VADKNYKSQMTQIFDQTTKQDIEQTNEQTNNLGRFSFIYFMHKFDALIEQERKERRYQA